MELMTRQELKNALLIYRAKNRLTQKEAAERMGFSLSTIRKAEQGAGVLDDVTVLRIMFAVEEDNK